MEDGSLATAPGESPRRRGGAGLAAAATALYLAATLVATWPMATRLTDAVPGSATDMLQHLRTMRWYKLCLAQGRSPLVCPELQYPVGAPLGHFSPTTLQGLLFIPLSAVARNDVLCLNLIWIAGFVTTGLGTMLLAGRMVPHRGSAWLAGLLAMLSGPMMLHSGGHLELIWVGAFPLFLVAWIAFVDAPSPRRLLASAGAYLLLAMSSPYFVVLGMFPAAWYVAWMTLREGRRAAWGWLGRRAAWGAAFCGIVLAGLVPLFAGQVWSVLHGDTLARPRGEFDAYGAPLWGYFVPTASHLLSGLLPADFYKETGTASTMAERASYPGMVTLALLAYAATHRLRLSRAGFWWSTLALLVLLSCGSYWQIGPRRVELPSLWLWRSFFAFKLIRVPARFNLFADVIAAALAAAGLAHLLQRLRRPSGRAAVLAGLALLAMVDLSFRPYPTWKVPAMPAAYRQILARNPRAAMLEVPEALSSGAYLNAACGYWQTLHGGRTTAGYTAHANAALDQKLYWNSPFSTTELSNPDYLKDPSCQDFGIITQAPFDAYAWAFLAHHGLDTVVLHRWPGANWGFTLYLERLQSQLEPARVYEDAETVVYDRARLRRPDRPVVLCDEGWRPGWDGRLLRVVPKRGSLVVYNPDPNQPLRLAIAAKAFREPRTVRLLDGSRELARWRFETEAFQLVASAPFRLLAGFHELELESDGERRPAHARDELLAGDRAPISLSVIGINLAPAPVAVAEGASPTRR